MLLFLLLRKQWKKVMWSVCAYKVCGLKISHKSLQSEIAVGLSGQLIQEKVAGGPYTQNSCLMLKFSLIFFFFHTVPLFFPPSHQSAWEGSVHRAFLKGANAGSASLRRALEVSAGSWPDQSWRTCSREASVAPHAQVPSSHLAASSLSSSSIHLVSVSWSLCMFNIFKP